MRPAGAASQPGAGMGYNPQAASGSEIIIRLICMKGEKLGLSLDCYDGATLIITKITEGIMSTWNNAHPNMAIKTGDRIVSANGQRGDPKAVLEETQKGGELSLGIVRGS